jgi:hypothetical protein
MGDWKCTICPEVLPSLSEYKAHVLKEHNAYANPPKPDKDLTIQTLNSLRSIKQRVHWLYCNKASTKGDDNLLVLEYLKYFEKTLIYTPETQRISFRDPNGITYKQFMYMSSFESITRAGRLIRAQDRKMFHDADGRITKEHMCMLASEKTELMRERREDVIESNIKYL